MTTRIDPHYGRFVMTKCQGIWTPEGSSRGIGMESMSDVAIDNTVDYVTADDNQDAVAVEAYNVANKVACEVSITMDQMTRLGMAAQHFSDDIFAYSTQTAATDGTTTIPMADVFFNPDEPGIYQLRNAAGAPVQNASVVVLTYGTSAVPGPVTLVGGTHYTIDYLTGLIQLLVKPVTVVTPTNLVATWHSQAVGAEKRLMDIGGLSGTGLVGSLSLVGTNEGILWRLDFNKMRLGPDGSAAMQNIEKTNSIKLKGKVFAVSKVRGLIVPKKYRFYRYQELDQPADI